MAASIHLRIEIAVLVRHELIGMRLQIELVREPGACTPKNGLGGPERDAGASKNLLESSHEFHALKLHQRGEAFCAAIVILAL